MRMCPMKMSAVSHCEDIAANMWCARRTLYCLLLLSCVNTLAQQFEKRLYCQEDFFNATCSEDEVIIMKSAQYGRMRISKCVMRDYGHLGCSVNALRTTDSLCSGRRACQFRVFDYDASLKRASSCPDDIDSYMEASYSCEKDPSSVQTTDRIMNYMYMYILVAVAFSTGARCDSQPHLTPPPSSGYLASTQAQTHGVGTSRCPWRLKALPGQVFSLSLFYFPLLDEGSVAPTSECGYQLAVVNQHGVDSRRSVTKCDAEPEGGGAFYVTQSHDITITMGASASLLNFGKFLIKYQVTGCPDPSIPGNATLVRRQQDAVVRCKATQQTWNLICVGEKWTGELGNCTGGAEPSKEAWDMADIFNNDGFPYGILIVVAIGVALGVFSGGLLLSLAAMYMKRRRVPRSRCTDDPTCTLPEGRFCSPEPFFMEPPEGALDNDKNMAYQLQKGKCLEGCRHVHKEVCPYGDIDTIPPGHSGTGGRTRSHVYEMPRFV